MTTKAFGEPIVRKEDPRLVSGQGRYLDDLGHDALAVAFLRSPHASARIIDIDVADALEVPGLIGIYTYEDLEGRIAEPLPLLIPHPALLNGRTGYPLANEFVRHVGEAIVMVIAEDRYIAEVLKPVVGIENAKNAQHSVHPSVPNNVSAHSVKEVGDARAMIKAAPHKLSLDLFIERSSCSPLEGKGVYAIWEEDSQELRLWSSTQTSTGVRAAVAAKLDLPLQKVECIAPDVGGGFGVKIMHPWPEEVLIPWAARKLNRPVTSRLDSMMKGEYSG